MEDMICDIGEYSFH